MNPWIGGKPDWALGALKIPMYIRQSNTLIDSFANEEERKALWIALGARYSKVQFGEAMAQVIQRAA